MFRTSLVLAATLPILAACDGRSERPRMGHSAPALCPGETREMRALIRRHAAKRQIAETLLHRVIQRESDYRAGARTVPTTG